jgi:predicted phosphodiesterase
MSKIALLSDVHANIEAFEAVLNEMAIEGIKSAWLGGDLVGYGKSPSATVRRAMQLPGGCVIGNHDYMSLVMRKKGDDAFGKFRAGDRMGEGLILAAHELSDDEASWLGERPLISKLDGDAVLIHASLNQPEQWHYIENEESALPSIELMRGKARQLLFCGHTHLQRVFSDPASMAQLDWLDSMRFRIPAGLATVVIVGSVGEPREADAIHRADWATWDPEQRVVEFRHTHYHTVS